MNIKVDFDNIVVKEDKNDFNVKVLMLKGEKGDPGAASWGAITGTLSSQTDLKNALDGKANQSDFNTVSGQVSTNTSNIGTINGQITDINGELDDFEDLFYGNATVNDEDTSITLDNTVEAGFESFDLKGNTTQDGTPTPSSPIPVNVVSGDNEINVCGKNLFNKDSIVGGFVNADGTIGGDTNVYRTSDFIPIQPSTAYYKTLTQSPRTKYYDINKVPLNTTTYQDISIGGNAGTFTTPNNAYYLRISFPITGGTVVNIDTIMVHKGSTEIAYEPYQGNTYNIDLPSGMELCKIGSYQDYIYKDSDKWYLHKEIGKVILDENESWNMYQSNYFYANVGAYFYANIEKNGYTNLYQTISPTSNMTNFITNTSNLDYALNTHSSGLTIRIKDKRFTSLTDFTDWITNNNVICYFAYQTPINTEITDTTLISQLNALEQATSKNGETNISQVNDDLPFIIYAEAFANTFNGRMEGMDYKIDNCEVLDNKVTSITSGSTDSEYPSAKAVYDLFNSITDGDEVSY